MRTTVSAAVFLALAVTAANSRAAGPAATAKLTANRTQQRPSQRPRGFVWTNEEVDMLRESNVPISFFTEYSPAGNVPSASTFETTHTPSKDPEWYAKRAAVLRAELDDRERALEQQQEALAEARNGQRTTGGISLDHGNAGVTPESGIQTLRAQVQAVQDELDALADLARRNDISPRIVYG